MKDNIHISFRVILCLLILPLTSSCQENYKKTSCNSSFIEVFKEYDYENLNLEWLKNDTIFYKQLKKICNERPEQILRELKIDTFRKKDLGNGFFIYEGSYGKGYIGIFYTFIYKAEDLIGYMFTMNKKDMFLLERYGFDTKELFSKTKDFYLKEDQYVFHYNYGALSKPINKLQEPIDFNDRKRLYMTPYSGLFYGCQGGYGNGILDNRCLFKQIEQDLTKEDIFYIMHSINPASRLTAIEYYYKNINNFTSEEKKRIVPLIEDIYKELGDEIEILSHDIVISDNPRNAVKRQLESDCW